MAEMIQHPSDDFWADQLTPRELNGHHWESLGECDGTNADIFFSESSAFPAEAIRLCGECIVREMCLQNALQPKTMTQGVIRAALTKRELKNLRVGYAADPEGTVERAHELQAKNLDKAYGQYGKAVTRAYRTRPRRKAA